MLSSLKKPQRHEDHICTKRGRFMQSASKVTLDQATLARWSEKHLGQRLVSSREINDGWFNTIHVLQLADGSQVVFKASPPPTFAVMRYERDILATEVAVYRCLAQAGLRVPRVLVDCPAGDGLGHAWFMMEFVAGETWARLRQRLPADQCDRVDADIAQQAAHVNGIEGARFGRWQEDHCSSPSWATSFLLMVEDLLADAQDKSVDLPWGESRLRALFRAAHAALDEVKTPQLVLWDLHDGNVMVQPDSLELAAFLDTDRALWGDPLLEFYFRGLANSSDAWKQGYRQACAAAGKIDPLETPGAARRLALYDLYLALVMLIESTYRQYGAEHKAWARDLCERALAACAAG
jgi:aminoglycoside phosphotransferase (APT) family kinase protein